ncbi:ABC transporter permease [Niveispirillum sp.]|uniref:ABC transporter permease n=1 Tax=Niveispirillum sp. TaxID=1917217 RepID=UPI001B74989D|nr:ABC transporter permease [Niveispirillum sp.]MBP7334447.1 ABC transporter permease [Niveispirillum sp.]
MTPILAVCAEELGRILTLKPARSVLIMGMLLYAAFYPQPYLNEALHDVPIALVDQDGSTSSLEFARRLDASPDLSVAAVLPDVPSAERAILARDLYGILLIPRDFEQELLHGRASPLALYADASYLLMYQRMSSGVSAVARAFGAEVETARLVGIGVDPALAGAAVDPMPLTAVPLFNPQSGYATYLLPAALVLILQQLLLIGTGLLGTLPRPTPGVAAGPATRVGGRLLAYLCLQVLVVPFYLVVLPWIYDIPRLGSPLLILAVALPFVLAVGALGQVVAGLFRQPLLVQLAAASIGLPFFFLAGFAWPAEAMPAPLRLLAELVPSTSAIEALVGVGQLGAGLTDVRTPFLMLWGLAGFYGLLAIMLERRRQP